MGSVLKAFSLGLVLCVAVSAQSGTDSLLEKRLDRMDSLVKMLSSEVNELRGAVIGPPSAPVAIPTQSQPQQPQAAAAVEEPLAGKLLSGRQKAMLQASASSFTTTAVGLTFSMNMPFAFNVIHWSGKYGYKAEAGALIKPHPDPSSAGGRAALLRSLHTFSLFGGPSPVMFRLYGLGGFGYFWKEVDDWDRSSSLILYDTPDRFMEVIIGAGTELTLGELGGVRVTPEIGYKASYYFSRFQDSGNWAAQLPGSREERPANDFSLGLHFGFNLYFYFR